MLRTYINRRVLLPELYIRYCGDTSCLRMTRRHAVALSHILGIGYTAKYCSQLVICTDIECADAYLVKYYTYLFFILDARNEKKQRVAKCCCSSCCRVSALTPTPGSASREQDTYEMNPCLYTPVCKNTNCACHNPHHPSFDPGSIYQSSRPTMSVCVNLAMRIAAMNPLSRMLVAM